MPPICIAVDAMGGDYAPAEVVAGAVEGARQHHVSIRLVGDPQIIRAALAQVNFGDVALEIVPASEIIQMDEDPAFAVRSKKEASITIACRMVKEGRAEAVVTMGHTGAAAIAALLVFGRIPGALRPAVIVPFLGMRERTGLIDAGAMTEVEPRNLLQFAIMGSLYVERVWGIPRPRVALLANGREDNKGNAVTKAAFPLLAASGLNFIGNIEGHDIPRGAADVVVHDGFVGNVVLKLAEGLTAELLNQVEGELLSAPGMDQAAVRSVLGEIRQANHYSRYGAMPLLGVDGWIFIGHGRSHAPAVVNAIGGASQAVQSGVLTRLRASLAS